MARNNVICCFDSVAMLYECVVLLLQTLETPLHYTARSGNEDILMEIVYFLGPAKTLMAVNKQAKV